MQTPRPGQERGDAEDKGHWNADQSTAPPAEPQLLSAALAYASSGWRVFPAPPGEKKSHKSAEFSNGRKWGATVDAEEITADWQRWPSANIGIVTGPESGLLIVEADTLEGHGVDGLANLNVLLDQHGPWPDTIEAISPSGSRHFYFRWPSGRFIRNSAGQVAPGVDVRGDGGMVIAPPSVKPGHALPYRWANPPGLFDLADCPDWLLALCEKKSAKRDEAPSQADAPDCTASWADAALRGEIAALLAAPEGQRNDVLNCAAYSLGQIVAGGGLPEGYVRQRLTAAALSIGLDAAEVEKTISSGMAAGSAEPRGPKEENESPGWTGKDRKSAGASAKTDDAESATDSGPVDLWGSFEPPELPHGLLPSIIEDFTQINGAQMGCDPAGLAVAALVTCAAAIPDRVEIKVKRHDNWTESARLWAALIGLPSTRKSPIITRATGPLCRLDTEMMHDWRKKMSEYLALPKESKQARSPPLQTRLRLEDTTKEAAEEALVGSSWGVLLVQDELTGFFGAMDKYNGGKGAARRSSTMFPFRCWAASSPNRSARSPAIPSMMGFCSACSRSCCAPPRWGATNPCRR